MVLRTWKDDLHGIKFKFLKHSNPTFKEIHEVMNGIYKSEVDDKVFHDIFTDENRDTLKTNCASLLLDAIWQLVTDRATTTDNAGYLKNIILGCKTKLAITFSVLASDNTDLMKYLPATCGEEMGKGLFQDLLNHIVNNITKAYASIQYNSISTNCTSFLDSSLKTSPEWHSHHSSHPLQWPHRLLLLR